MHKLLIIGEKFHGKTTLAKQIQAILGDAQTFSTSAYLVYRLALVNNTTSEAILADKEKYRPELIRLGNAMCDADPGCLVSICLWSCHSKCVIIDGIRRISEYSRVKDWFDQIIWIQRPGIEPGLDNLELKPEHAHQVVVNDGDLDDLNQKAKQIATQFSS